MRFKEDTIRKIDIAYSERKKNQKVKCSNLGLTLENCALGCGVGVYSNGNYICDIMDLYELFGDSSNMICAIEDVTGIEIDVRERR